MELNVLNDAGYQFEILRSVDYESVKGISKIPKVDLEVRIPKPHLINITLENLKTLDVLKIHKTNN